MKDEMITCGDGQTRRASDLVGKSHREAYPEQYTHPAVGQTMRLKGGRVGKVDRVTKSRFGVMVHFEDSGETWYRLRDCVRVASWPFEVGTRVRLVHDVERFPHFIAPAGSTGRVSYTDEETFEVRMDEHLDGAEEWQNAIVWTKDHNDPAIDCDPLDRLPFEKEFGPEFAPPASISALAAENGPLEDVSWHNDACPSFAGRLADGGWFRLFTDAEDMEDRDDRGLGHRFGAFREDAEGEVDHVSDPVLLTDDPADVVAFVQKERSELRDAVRRLARTFTDQIWNALGGSTMERVARLNRANPNPKYCYTTEHADAVGIMAESFGLTFGRQPELEQSGPDAALINLAWTHAKKLWAIEVEIPTGDEA